MSYNSKRWYEDSKYHGLINQGATCYLNSVLQVLFMTEDFREAVQRKTSGDCIDVQLASLFNDLKTHTAQTVGVTQKLGIRNVCEQRDAAEHFEKILTLCGPEAAQIFRGNLSHKTICSECCSDTDEDAPFWDLPLALVKASSNSYSVEHGIQEFFKDSDFSGENQMYCDNCCAKCDATAKCVIKHHPEVLMLLLKRFEFSYQQMTFVKNSCPVDVPPTLEIPEDQTYELYAFVEHFGSLKGGHYTATINSQDNENTWYCFNDSSVTPLNNQPFQGNKTERTKSAYLLFYRKKKTQDITELPDKGGRPSNTKENYEQRPDVDRRGSGKDALKRKVSYDEHCDHHAPKQKKDERRKKGDDDEEGSGGKAEADVQTERSKPTVTVPLKTSLKVHKERTSGKKEMTKADRPTSRTDRHLDKHGALQYAKDKPSDSFHEQDLPHKHEQQGDRRFNVQADTERMPGVNKHPLRDGVHDKQNRPSKSQDDNRERHTSHEKLSERQQKQTERRNMGDDEEGMRGKVQSKGQADRGKNEMREVKTGNHRKSGHKEEGHERTKEKKEKTEAGGPAARNDKQLGKQRMGSVESQKDITAHRPSNYRGNKEDDEHNKISVETSPSQAEPGETIQTWGAGTGSPQPKKKRISERIRKFFKKGSDESKKGAKQKKEGAGKSQALQHGSEDQEMEKTPGCFSFFKKRNKQKREEQSVSQKD